MSEEKMEHSPLPWRVSGKQSIRGFGEGSWIAKANWYRGPANAQFIVTACNSYYEHKAAIAELVEALSNLAEGPNDSGPLIAARAIVAKHKAGK